MANLPFNLFDILLAVVLVGGIVRGRTRGVSLELLSTLKWLTTLLVCAIVYQPLGALVETTGFFDLLTCQLFCYLGTALLIFLLFSILERRLGPKVAGSDIFGRSEYFLGMGSGAVRFLSILFIGLALLNAREFSPLELRQMERYQEETYGTDIFPGVHSMQEAVFDHSFSGGFIKAKLGFLLMKPTLADERNIVVRAHAK